MDILSPKLPFEKLQGVLQEICKNGSEVQENWTSLVDTAMALTDSLSQTLCMDMDKRNNLESLVIRVWNKTVMFKTKGTVQKDVYAKLRHISYQVVSFLNESTGDLPSLKQQIMMGLKTTRTWLDVKEFPYAEKVINNLHETIQKLQHILVERKSFDQTTEEHDKEMSDVGKDLLCALCLKAEVNFFQNQNTEAMAAVKKAEEILPSFSDEVSNLSIMCYNFGVDCYQAKEFEKGVQWLRQSCSFHKDIVQPNLKSQARTLRLLANCYLEARCGDWKELAHNAVLLANQKHCHVAGLYVRLQLLLETEEEQASVQQATEELINHPSFEIDLCLNMLRLFKNFQRPEVVFSMRKQILEKFERHQKSGSVSVTLLDILLQPTDPKQASIFAEECITAHNTGNRLEGLFLKQFHIAFWNKAAHYFENQDYEKAVTWYNYSLSLYPSTSVSEPNMAKLQRNLSNCYLNLGATAKALAAIEVAERCDKKDAHTQFIIFKIALEMEDTEKALQSVKTLVECVNSDPDSVDINVIRLVAHTALEQRRTQLATISLGCIISHCKDYRQVLTALKCVIRIMLDKDSQKEETDKREMLMLCHVRTAYNKIIESKERGLMASGEIEEEANWFMKIAWNIALQCKHDPYRMKEFFNLCLQLLWLCAQNVATFHRHQNCLLMACAACLQLARQPDRQHDLQELLKEVLQLIEEFKQGERRAQNTLWSHGGVKTPASTEVFLLLYEFEALTKLKDGRAETVLDRALTTMINPLPKLFHTFAVLATDAPANSRKLKMRALKVAIRLHLQNENPDYIKCSADVRTLIGMSLVLNEKEAMIYLKETMDVIEKRAKESYPEVELLWLMTKAWNWGLQHYNCEKLGEAELWCSTGLAMLKFLPGCRDQYEEQMMSVYGEILNRLEDRDRHKNMEE